MSDNPRKESQFESPVGLTRREVLQRGSLLALPALFGAAEAGAAEAGAKPEEAAAKDKAKAKD